MKVWIKTDGIYKLIEKSNVVIESDVKKIRDIKRRIITLKIGDSKIQIEILMTEEELSYLYSQIEIMRRIIENKVFEDEISENTE